MTVSTVKALHIIGFTCWFSGLFYVVRLFVYNCEARDDGNITMAETIDTMQRRLLYAITCPMMLMTLVFGVWLMNLITGRFAVVSTWLYVKLTLVSFLVCYTLLCVKIHKQLASGTCSWTSRGLRILNEVATVFLVFIVFIAVFKHAFSMKVMLSISLGLAAVFVPGFMLFGRHRHRHKDITPTLTHSRPEERN